MIVFLFYHGKLYAKIRVPSNRVISLKFNGQTYKNTAALEKELTRCALEARKSYRHAAFNSKGWRRVDPVSYEKAIEIGAMRRILRKIS